ncbi:MAG: YggT family protein [Pseudomonadota bacterium]
MQGLLLINDIIGMLVSVLVMLIIIQFVIGLLFAFNVVSPTNQFLMSFYQSISSLLDPILRPIRRIMPDTGAIDFSPIVLILGLNILQAVVGRAVLSLV